MSEKIVISEESLDKLAELLATRVNQRRKDCDCIYDISPSSHAAHHRLITNLSSAFDKIDSIKWGIIGSLARTLVYVVLAIFLMGLALKSGWIKSPVGPG